MKNQNFSHFGLTEEYQDPSNVIEPRKEAMFDGYSFGDRLLEGVMFIVKVEDDGMLSVRISDESADYFKELNQKLWLDRALEFALTNDVFEGLDGEDDINLIRIDGTMSFE